MGLEGIIGAMGEADGGGGHTLFHKLGEVGELVGRVEDKSLGVGGVDLAFDIVF